MKLYTKKLIIALTFCLTMISVKSQTFTWDGGGATNNASEGANWVGDAAPAFDGTESLVFDGTSSKNCDFDVDPIDIVNLNINAGYTGTIDGDGGGLGPVVLIDGNITQAAGTFIASSTVVEINGGNYVKTGGTFVHNNGIFSILLTTNSALNSETYNVIAVSGASSATRIMNFNGATADAVDLSPNGRSISYQGTVNLRLLTINTSTNTASAASNTGTFNFNDATATINSSAAAGTVKLPNVTFNTAGALDMTGNISVTRNWTSTQIGSFTPGTSTVHFYGALAGVVATADRAYFDNMTVATGAVLNVTNNSVLDFNLNFTHDGTFTGNTSLLMFTGGVGHTIGGSAALTTINAIEKADAGSLVFDNPTNLLDSVRITGGAVTIGAGGSLTLKSTSALKARIAEISGGGSFTGSATVETFIPGGATDWAMLGASGVSGLSFNSWYGQIPMAIENSATGVTSAGGQYFESVWRWDETGAISSIGYDSTVVVGDPINLGEGYWIFVGNGLSSTSAITTTVTGAVNTGNNPIAITSSGVLPAGDDGFNLVANPFASPISWDRIFADPTNTDVNGTIYVYNADLGVPTSYNAATQTSSHGTGIKSGIAMGQGFYVESNQAAGTLNINENHKVAQNTGANPLLKTNATSSSASARLRLKINGGGFEDESVVCFLPSATTGFDNRYDGWKLYASPGYAGYGKNPWTLRTTISTLSGNDDYSINSLPLPLTANAVIPVLAKVYASGQHTISAYDINLPSGTCVTLKDKLLNVTHNLAASPYVCILSDTATTARFELTVCANITMGVNNMPIVAENVFIKQDRNGVYVDLNFESSTKAIITANNILGQQLMTPKSVECVSGKYYLDLNAKEQIIMVSVIANDKRTTKKIFVENNN